MTTGRVQKVPQFPFLDQLIQVVPKIPTVFCSMSMVLIVLKIQTLIAFHGVSSHLIRSLEEWLIFYFLQNLMYRFSEYSVNHLRGWSILPCEISHRIVIIISVWPEIPPLLRDNLLLSFPLRLVLFHSFVFVNLVHKLTYTGDRLTSQGFPQAVLSWEIAFKSADGDVIKVSVYLIIHFPISVRVCFYSFSLMHG